MVLRGWLELSDFYAVDLESIDGTTYSMDIYREQVILVVNVASQCGFTSQYSGLEALWKTYQDQGFSVLGFPCDQFGGQEPDTDAEIATFCETAFGVTFPMHTKVKVNGPQTHALYQHLKKAAPGLLGSQGVKWNFTKFLVGPGGMPVRRYGSMAKPESMVADIKKALGISDVP